ncbi:hypothetical protein [Absidia glauca]|uniref:Uncharacterized protein n=1 Tax=Absidia glauca TaxID=4829 RepID=A0A163MFZ2_ABSGL|nr:hypothetical protein [Absidia glauca]
MYHTDSHPDPYANQYPPPPPLPAAEHRDSTSSANGGYTPPPFVPPPQQTYTPPMQAVYTAPAIPLVDRQEIASAGHYEDPSFHSVPIMKDPKTHYGQQHGADPHTVTMEEYRQTEQHERLYNGQPHQPQESYYMDDDYSPMVPPQQQQRPPTKNYGPVQAPVDEAEAYRPKVYQREEHGRGCNCCCYNPAMTCCSCFCFLISLGFLAAGVALIIAAKVIGDKCNAQCGEATEKAASYGVDAQPCDAICGKVVHDGMFYGGIAVAALAGIAAVWKIFMWMCAAGSRR